MAPEKVPSVVTCKYLVKHEDYNYLIKVCLLYLMHDDLRSMMHDDFRNMTCSNSREARRLSNNFLFYEYAMQYLCHYIRELTTGSTGITVINEEVQGILQRFLSVPVHAAFRLWGLNVTKSSCDLLDGSSGEILET